ncbi:MAG: FkbM family methyltransferase [Anaerolineaceae bacterium]|nr:FkbM family methyltransferase [Anaerolineaceae bacterium]
MQHTRAMKLLSILQVAFYRKALVSYGVAASVEHDVLLCNLGKEIKCVIDIGANRGQFALAARKNFPDARIISFEPLSEPAAVFTSLFQSDPLVTLHEIALGPESNEMTFHVSNADDSSSLLPISTLQNELFHGTDEKEVRKVIVKPLDAVLCEEDIQAPALLKMDVQGFEKEALQGCKKLLPLFAYLYIECSFVELYVGQSLVHDVIAFLSEYGFGLSGIYNLCYDGKGLAVQGDFLFSRIQ